MIDVKIVILQNDELKERVELKELKEEKDQEIHRPLPSLPSSTISVP